MREEKEDFITSYFGNSHETLAGSSSSSLILPSINAALISVGAWRKAELNADTGRCGDAIALASQFGDRNVSSMTQLVRSHESVGFNHFGKDIWN